MKLFYCFLVVALASTYASSSQPLLESNSFILTDVNIVDVENKRIIAKQSIFVKNGIIETITDNFPVEAQDSVPIYNGKGGYISPGLIDMHVHIYEPAAFLMTLSHGVTHVRIMNGIPKQLEWRDQIEAGLMQGSTASISSPIISGYTDAYLHHGVTTAEQAKQAVIQYHQQGYDLIKAYGNLSQQALTGLTHQANLLNMPVAKHGPHATGSMHISELQGLQSFEHVEDIYQGPLQFEMNTDVLSAVIKALKQTRVPITPTLSIFNQLTKLSQQGASYIEKSSAHYTSDIIALEARLNQVKRWVNSSAKVAAHNQQTMDFLTLITKRLHEQEVPLLVGSDSGALLSPHGISTHTELRLLQEAGLTPFEVLRAATINPAKSLKLEKQLGKISKNYFADLIYTATNPIQDLSILEKPDAVIKRGRWYDQDDLILMRDKGIESRSIWRELLTLYEAME